MSAFIFSFFHLKSNVITLLTEKFFSCKLSLKNRLCIVLKIFLDLYVIFLTIKLDLYDCFRTLNLEDSETCTVINTLVNCLIENL